MTTKITKSSYPAGHGANDFQCFGPPALNDGQFENCKIADLGSFSQEDKDSNKYYHASVVKSKINNRFYTYFEWGRVGASNPQFQMTEHSSEAEAQDDFEKQCHSKNDKRGVWATVAGLRTLTAKPKKDVYLVRQLTTRSTGLPDAKTIRYIDPNASVKKPDKKAASGPAQKQADIHTSRLLQDLIGGTIKYTRSAMADNSLPTQVAIDQGRTILIEAQKRVAVVGRDLDDQIADKDLRTFSAELYRRIPKVKTVGSSDKVWILSADNIVQWQQDLDAFESALTGQTQIDNSSDNVDPFHGLPLHMEWIDPKSEIGKFLYFWWPKATANKHYNIGTMKIINLWKIDRHGDTDKFTKAQDAIYKDVGSKKNFERPLFQPSERPDVSAARQKIFQASNTALLFHGTRSVNVKGILEKSLLLPKQLVGVSTNGAMFGPGLYWADDLKKSAGYTSLNGAVWSRGSGVVSGRQAFMFAADVVLGDPFIAPGAHGYTAPPKGSNCVFGMGSNHPTAKQFGESLNKGYRQQLGSGVQNNEWIVFNSDQCQLKYLAEFSA